MDQNWLILAVVIVGMGIVTYGIRLAMILLLGRVEIPPLVRRALRFVPPAVLSAIIVPELLGPGSGPLFLVNPRLLASALAALIAWRSQNTLLAIGLGMLAFWLLQAGLGF